ncbi:hypothetical protein BaRGS_00007683 [Batillaria attramentaria]|uniref:Uncharacterized protein n=1 Tax=Batillaria attramentaria TaxID=370345 RepID=A0ABD0LQB0_9CAEN
MVRKEHRRAPCRPPGHFARTRRHGKVKAAALECTRATKLRRYPTNLTSLFLHEERPLAFKSHYLVVLWKLQMTSECINADNHQAARLPTSSSRDDRLMTS